MWSELGKARHSKTGKAMFQLKGIEATPFSDNPMFFFVERQQCAVGAWNGWSPVSDIEGASNMCANHHKCVWLYFIIYIIIINYIYIQLLPIGIIMYYIFSNYHDALMPLQIPINTRSNSMWNSTDHPAIVVVLTARARINLLKKMSKAPVVPPIVSLGCVGSKPENMGLEIHENSHVTSFYPET
jgi:hypothetical protein